MIYSDPGCTTFEDTPMLAGSPYFREVLAAFACPLHAVRLMRLTPGSVIKEHHDNDLSFEQGMVRIHIPVVTNDGVDFRLNGTRCPMPAGSVWYLRLSDPHSVANRGMDDRVHLVIDAAVNGWVEALFQRAMRGQAA
jgi:aspartyl/asparaginyl beta-hydroxylase (cupin superfamily)